MTAADRKKSARMETVTQNRDPAGCEAADPCTAAGASVSPHTVPYIDVQSSSRKRAVVLKDGVFAP